MLTSAGLAGSARACPPTSGVRTALRGSAYALWQRQMRCGCGCKHVHCLLSMSDSVMRLLDRQLEPVHTSLRLHTFPLQLMCTPTPACVCVLSLVHIERSGRNMQHALSTCRARNHSCSWRSILVGMQVRMFVLLGRVHYSSHGGRLHACMHMTS